MSRLFGEMRQVGIVVRDIEAAMRHWVVKAHLPSTSFHHATASNSNR